METSTKVILGIGTVIAVGLFVAHHRSLKKQDENIALLDQFTADCNAMLEELNQNQTSKEK